MVLKILGIYNAKLLVTFILTDRNIFVTLLNYIYVILSTVRLY